MTTIAEMTEIIAELSKFENELDALKGQQKKLNEEIDARKMKLISILQESGLTSFKSPWGTVTVNERFSVKMPKDDEGKLALKEYMEKKGIFENMWNINYQALNAWYKSEVEEAKAKGEYIDIPSLEPTVDHYLSFRTK